MNDDCSFHRTQGIQQASHSQFYTAWQERREMLNSHPLMVGQWSQRWGHVWCSTPAAAVPRWQGYTWNTQPFTGEVTYLSATAVVPHWQSYTWNTQPLTGAVTYLTPTTVALHWQGDTWNTQPFTGEVPSNIQPQQLQLNTGKATPETLNDSQVK